MKKRIVEAMLMLGMVLSVAGCANQTGVAETANYGKQDNGEQIETESENTAEKQTDTTEEVPTEEISMEEWRYSYLNFSIELLKEIHQENENQMISPVSLLTALTMAENGAQNETLKQMEQVLAQNIPVEVQTEMLNAYRNQLPNDKKAHFYDANSIWIRDSKELHIDKQFIKEQKKQFDAAVEYEPFDQKTTEKINKWVKSKTKNMIPHLLDELSKEDMMCLINAVAFEAEWDKIYQEEQIKQQTFYGSQKETEASFMYSEEDEYMEDDNTVGFTKPYAGEYDFVALLPKEEISMEEYLKQLTADRFEALLQQDNMDYSVAAAIPRFQSDYSIELQDILEKEGMPDAFSEDRADFSQMGYSDQGNLFISQVIHKTYVSIDENGTKAGAASAVIMAKECMLMPKEIKEVILDRPFVYAIVDRENRLPVFIGVAENITE